ncbi:MAG: hypothetical protein ABI832_06095 [bacterium]
MSPRLTVFFIVEPPEYQVMACYLAASLREQFGDTVALVGYCPADKLDLVQDEVKRVLGLMGCEVRPFQVQGRFDPAYPHGNKILATMEPRDTEFSCFMDSDILCLRPNAVENITAEGKVSLTPAAWMGWGKQDGWQAIYDTVGLPLPEDRIRLMKQKKGDGKVPYFSSGLFSFPEQFRTAEGKSFPQVWYDVAQLVDTNPDIDKKRPYLDQMTLPLAIQKAGLDWNILPDAQHFILGGRQRGDPIPQDREIFTVHYRKWPVLKEAGLSGLAKTLLQKHVGIKKIVFGMQDDPGSPEDARAARREKKAARLAKAG